MRTCYAVSIEIRALQVPSILRAVSSLVPEAREPQYCFCQDFDIGDARVAQIVAVLEAHHVPRISMDNLAAADKSPVGYFSVSTVHRYDADDYQTSEAFLVAGLDPGRQVVGVNARTVAGEFIMDARGLPRARTILGHEPMLMVREKFRPTLDGEGFVGMGYRKAVRGRQTSDRDERGIPIIKVMPTPPGEDIYEIWPTVELPPMYEPEIEWRRPHMPPPHTRQGPGKFVNPGFDDGQPVYTREAIASVGPFDIARTWEYPYPRQEDVRFTIVSQRFYRFCRKHKVDGTFVPVKIVEPG